MPKPNDETAAIDAAHSQSQIRRLRIRVEGAVQGVGFRPFVHRLAACHELSGFVLNEGAGVLAEVEGANLSQFLASLQKDCPPLARIDGVSIQPIPVTRITGFAIRRSAKGASIKGQGIPDIATCNSCLRDLFDQASRFYHYPFVTCTDCGPRFTIVRQLPYDRPNTAMSHFVRCKDCERDYTDPLDRRFHAETIACRVCGPRMSHPIEIVARALKQGQIIALKGTGGFHLVCDATNETSVQTLRRRKNRPDKPFAIMVANAQSLSIYGEPSSGEIELLSSTARPVVLVRKGEGLAASIAPRLNRIGVMLPAAPVYHLLFEALAASRPAERNLAESVPVALVVTSANSGGDPIIVTNAAARRRLTGLADLIVTHDRPVLARADDSVMSITDEAPAYIRRSRGFVPEPVHLGQDGPSVLAAGGHLKATICVTRGREAFVSQHIGDLDNAETVRYYQATARHMLDALAITPELAVCDLHPDYRSTIFAESLGLPVLRVQHHAAHLAAAATEHGLRGSILGVVLDGYGRGDDAASWGGELILLNSPRWRRCGHLLPLALPGGDRAAREPWRMGIAALNALGRGAEAAERFSQSPYTGHIASFAGPDIPALKTTSMGRLFDAAAAILGVCTYQSYEGQAAMELEALVRTPVFLPGGYRIVDHILDFRPLLAALLEPGLDRHTGAELFHGTLITGLTEWIGTFAAGLGQTNIVLTGGCLMNHVLADGLASTLRAQNLAPLMPRAMPANDGGLCLGQAAMGRAHLMAGPSPLFDLD